MNPSAVSSSAESGAFRSMLKGMPPQPENLRFEAQHAAMGTIYSIAAYAPPSISLEDAVERAFAEIDRLDELMSHYRPPSEICAINRGAFAAPVSVSAELFALLEQAFRLSEATSGAFDVTVGALMKVWGFFRQSGRIPISGELAQTLERTGFRRVRLDPHSRTIAFASPGIELDLGAIGKGYAVDRAAAVLREHGVRNALISSGTSSIAALGAPPGQPGWKISLCHPFDRRKQVRALRLSNLSISVSGGSEQVFVLDGRAYTHLLDPRSGRPVEGMLMSAVIAASNALTDALSTAVFVLGVDGSRDFLVRNPGLTALLFLPAAGRTIEQIVLASADATLPEGSFLRLEDE
jgi:thiamine biosynthesis lipoprotein